jgi:hypothetical protein
MKKILMMAVLSVMAMGVGKASIIPNFVGTSDLGGGVFAYSYDVFVQSPGHRIQFTTTAGPGGIPAGGFDNHFTFFDFAGYVANSASCSGPFCGNFTASAANLGSSAFVQAPPDSASIPNVTWTMTSSGATIPPGSLLGRFTMNSTFSDEGVIYFSAQATRDGGTLDGTVTGNTLATVGPEVPEPATMLLLGLGLIALSISHKRLAKRNGGA